MLAGTSTLRLIQAVVQSHLRLGAEGVARFFRRRREDAHERVIVLSFNGCGDLAEPHDRFARTC